MHIGTNLYWNGTTAWEILPDGAHIKRSMTFDDYYARALGRDRVADNRVSTHPHRPEPVRSKS